MANGKDHKEVAIVIGAVTACVRAADAPGSNALIETIGGALGGLIGGKLPDIIDPPTHPLHRSIGHGVIPVGAAAHYYVENIAAWQGALRLRAKECGQRAACASSDGERTKYLLLETFFQLAAGFAIGIGAGYISHLAMDACTKRGLPLVA